MLRWFLAKDEKCRAPQLKNLGKSLQNLRLFGVFPMERLTQALVVNEIKYIRQKETTSHLYLFLSFLAPDRNLNRAGLKGTFHGPGVHLCSPRPSSSVQHVRIETEPSQRQQIPKNFSLGQALFKWKVLARKSPSCICKGPPRSRFVQMTPGLEQADLGTSA